MMCCRKNGRTNKLTPHAYMMSQKKNDATNKGTGRGTTDLNLHVRRDVKPPA